MRGRRAQRASLPQDLSPDERIQAALGDQIHPGSEQYAELPLKRAELEEADHRVGHELHEHIDVAVGPEVTPSARPEDQELPHLIATADLCERTLGNDDAGTYHYLSLIAPALVSGNRLGLALLASALANAASFGLGIHGG